ncbi:MAG: precorrin-2 C(20)-methyltransferase [Thermodesulfovibrionales bacterium]|nr:precorrin-2 C(20)-methyltransferase [Thermodesulfovibrionales bacterium]
MTGKLYVIGVGPGDPELLTLKAVRILREVPCICVPKGKEEGQSLALSIAQKAINLDGKEILEAYFPMVKTRESQESGVNSQGIKKISVNGLDEKWDEAADAILNKLKSGTDVAFLTIGDPTIYSTFFYVHERLVKVSPCLQIVFIPGISSINASAAAAGTSLSLADEKIAILPATYIEDIKDTLKEFDTVILMKVHRVFSKIRSALRELALIEKTIYISRAGMDEEKIFKNLDDVKDEDLNYFSLMIIRK